MFDLRGQVIASAGASAVSFARVSLPLEPKFKTLAPLLRPRFRPHMLAQRLGLGRGCGCPIKYKATKNSECL